MHQQVLKVGIQSYKNIITYKTEQILVNILQDSPCAVKLYS